MKTTESLTDKSAAKYRKDTMVSIRMPMDWLIYLDRRATAEQTDRSALIRHLMTSQEHMMCTTARP